MKLLHFLKQFSFFALLLTFVFASNGCDALAKKLGVDKVKVPLTSIANAVPVKAGTPTVVSGNVNVGTVNLPDIFDISSIQFDKTQFTFTPSANVANKTQTVGTIKMVAIMGGYPLALVTINLTDNVVTDITPNPVALGAFTVADVQALINALPAAQRPTLATNWNTLTAAQLATEVNKILKTLNFNVALIISSDVSGTLSIKSMDLNLKF
jgi:hypothetical protein